MLVYTTGTINDADAGSVGLAMANQIRDDLVAHAAWELVEEFTPSSGLVRWYVFKCLATESGLPADFYVVMGRTLGSGELRFAICESYTSATHTMAQYPHSSSTTPPAYDSVGRSPKTYVLGTAAFAGSSDQPVYLGWAPSGTSTKWWLIIDDDGFTVAFNGASNGFAHIGAYTPLTDSSMPIALPLQIVGSGSSAGGVSRNPAVASSTPAGYNNAMNIYGGGGVSIQSWEAFLGFLGQFKFNDKLQGNKRPVAEMGIQIVSGSTDFSTVTGWALGKQNRMRVSNQAMPTGFAFGDAFALDGSLWVPYKPDDGRIWDTGVAA